VTTIVLVRHAATDFSGRRYSGRGDPPLSADGRREAEALAERLQTVLPAGVRIVTSPSRRAHDTAAILATRLAPAVIDVDERWMETDVGEAEGLTFDEVAARYPDLAVRLASGDAEIDWPGGETASALSERVAGAWAALLVDRGPTVVVSHAGTLRIAQALATGRPPIDVPFPGTAEAVFIEVEGSVPSLGPSSGPTGISEG
jgi:broad specificity phosphatase PhoE